MFSDVDIDTEGLPPEELSAAWAIKCNIIYMEGAVREFVHTVQLYHAAYNRRRQLNAPAAHIEMQGMSCWMGIAGRNGAILMCSILDVMEDTKGLKAPVLWSRTDKTRRKRAFNRIGTEFPNIRRIRDSAAHPGELAASPAELKKHMVQGGQDPSGGVRKFFTQHLYDADDERLIYHSSFNGQNVQYELSRRKAQILQDIVHEFSWAILLPSVRPPPGFFLETGEQPQQGQSDHQPTSDSPDER